MPDVRLTKDPSSDVIGSTFKNEKGNKNFPWETRSIYEKGTRYFENKRIAVRYLLERWANNRLKSEN